MLSELEARLADVIGAGLPAPFTGRVAVDPDSPAGPGPAITLAVTRAARLDPDFNSLRREILPERTTLHRVVRLEADLVLTVTAAPGEGRGQEMEGVDRLLYFFDDGESRDATALIEPGDQGFLVEELSIADVVPPTVTIRASGWFWPVGEPGQDGPEIMELVVRQAVLPISLARSANRIIAGGDPVDLALTVGSSGLVLERDQPPSAQDLGSLAVRLEGSGGRPGDGTLNGGTDGPGSHRVLAMADGGTSVGYVPPGTPTTDDLVVSMFVVDGAGEPRVGFELARFDLTVESA